IRRLGASQRGLGCGRDRQPRGSQGHHSPVHPTGQHARVQRPGWRYWPVRALSSRSSQKRGGCRGRPRDTPGSRGDGGSPYRRRRPAVAGG
ncbi:unnamed protein product, partial [Ectocarpus sp. 13 AM-2016]